MTLIDSHTGPRPPRSLPWQSTRLFPFAKYCKEMVKTVAYSFSWTKRQPAGRPFPCLKSQGGFRQGGLGQKALVPGYQQVPRGVPRLYLLGLSCKENNYSLCRTALARHALQAQARWMSRLCVDRLSVVDWTKILCILWEKCQGGCVDINTIFKIQTCIGEECFGRPFQFSCCSPKPVMGKTLSWQLQAGRVSLAFPANVFLDVLKRCRIWGKTFFWKPFAQKGNPETFLSCHFVSRYKTDCQSCSQQSSFFWSAPTVGDEIEILSV